MKSVFDQTVRNELIGRIHSLHENSQRVWGKMNVYQMIRHGAQWDEWIQNNTGTKQALIGRLFGKTALKKVLKDEAPLSRNTPTLPEFKIKETGGNIESAKEKWIALIHAYAHFSAPGFVHPFFGKMTREQVGLMAYKHADHHLRQFGN